MESCIAGQLHRQLSDDFSDDSADDFQYFFGRLFDIKVVAHNLHYDDCVVDGLRHCFDGVIDALRYCIIQ